MSLTLLHAVFPSPQKRFITPSTESSPHVIVLCADTPEPPVHLLHRAFIQQRFDEKPQDVRNCAGRQGHRPGSPPSSNTFCGEATPCVCTHRAEWIVRARGHSRERPPAPTPTPTATPELSHQGRLLGREDKRAKARPWTKARRQRKHRHRRSLVRCHEMSREGTGQKTRGRI